MRRISRDIEFVYFIDFGGNISFAGPYANKQPKRGGILRKFKLVEVPLDEKKSKPDLTNVLYQKTIDGQNVLITKGKVSDKIVYNAHIWIENMTLKKNHTPYDDQEIKDAFTKPLIEIKKKYGESE